MGLVENARTKPPASELFRPYSEEEKALLAKRYTPEQIRAIEAGEGAIRAEDLDRQGIIRTDIGSLNYLDDFRHYRSVVDKKPPDNTPVDPNARLMTEDEMSTSFRTYYDNIKKDNPPPPPKDEGDLSDEDFDPTRLNFFRADYDAPRYMGTNGPIPSGPNLFAPAIPKVISENGTAADGSPVGVGEKKDVNPLDPDGRWNSVIKQTGLDIQQIRSLNPTVLVQNFVTNMTRLGRVNSIYCIAIAGNKDGVLGIGQAKGQNGEATRHLAKSAAVRNLRAIPRYENRTIYGDSEAKVSAVKVKLMSRPPGKSKPCAFRGGAWN
jgi:small subunit ribosomal protein S5